MSEKPEKPEKKMKKSTVTVEVSKELEAAVADVELDSVLGQLEREKAKEEQQEGKGN